MRPLCVLMLNFNFMKICKWDACVLSAQFNMENRERLTLKKVRMNIQNMLKTLRIWHVNVKKPLRIFSHVHVQIHPSFFLLPNMYCTHTYSMVLFSSNPNSLTTMVVISVVCGYIPCMSQRVFDLQCDNYIHTVTVPYTTEIKTTPWVYFQKPNKTTLCIDVYFLEMKTRPPPLFTPNNHWYKHVHVQCRCTCIACMLNWSMRTGFSQNGIKTTGFFLRNKYCMVLFSSKPNLKRLLKPQTHTDYPSNLEMEVINIPGSPGKCCGDCLTHTHTHTHSVTHTHTQCDTHTHTVWHTHTHTV